MEGAALDNKRRRHSWRLGVSRLTFVWCMRVCKTANHTAIVKIEMTAAKHSPGLHMGHVGLVLRGGGGWITKGIVIASGIKILKFDT